VLHVGSCVPRKRIDVLLAAFAGLRAQFPDLDLVQIGGEWTAPQWEQVKRLGIGAAVFQARGLATARLAALYRRAAVVLQPSEAEGFGLPVAEALACGAAVVASDLPVLREVGGPSAVYCPVGDVAAWVAAVAGILAAPETAPPRAVRLVQARRYTWPAHADGVLSAYRRLMG
jgi:glycosyltransferase involved in cell wall biosynthesis